MIRVVILGSVGRSLGVFLGFVPFQNEFVDGDEDSDGADDEGRNKLTSVERLVEIEMIEEVSVDDAHVAE